MQRLGLSSSESTKFNLGFNGFVGRMIKRIKARNQDKYDQLNKNQLEIYTENNIKKKGRQDWASSSEDDGDGQNIGQDLERLDRKTVVMKLGKYKYAKRNTKNSDQIINVTNTNSINIDQNEDGNKNEILMSTNEETERIKILNCLMYLSNTLLVVEILWS